jgi:chorismate mutase
LANILIDNEKEIKQKLKELLNKIIEQDDRENMNSMVLVVLFLAHLIYREISKCVCSHSMTYLFTMGNP